VERHERDNPHLRSGCAVSSYAVHATDGDIGHVKGLLVDDLTWAIRYLIVSTGPWWGCHEVLVAPEWIEDVSWDEAKVMIDLNRQAVKGSPAFDPAKPLSRELESQTFSHYGREGYWPREAGGAAGHRVAPSDEPQILSNRKRAHL
jgi:hypothetical protein